MIAGDRALAERDRALPGLGVVLDGEALAAALQGPLPGCRVRLDYVRYKPATSCVAGIEIDAGGRRLLGSACAFRSGVPEKLEKARQRGGIVLADAAVVLLVLPAERRLRTLGPLLDGEARARVLRRALPDHPPLWRAGLEPLRYKPERRLVARLGEEALLKAYTETGHARARGAAKALGRAARAAGPRLPRLLGGSGRKRLLVFEWLEGRPLDELLAAGERLAEVAAAARALAALHALPAARLPPALAAEDAFALRAGAGAGEVAGPAAGLRARRLAAALERRLPGMPPHPRALHGDFSADQVIAAGDPVASSGPVALADLDAARAGHPAADVASFLADLELRAIDGRLPPARAQAAADALLDAYDGPDGDASALAPALAVLVPAALLRRVAEPFRRRHPDWPDRIEAVLERVEELAGAAPARSARARRSRRPLERIALARASPRDAARLGLAPGPLRLGRAWPDGDGGLLLEYADERRRIVGARWGPAAEEGAAWAGAGDGERVLLIGPDDRRLPGLAATLAEPGARLVGHRPGRRAVVRLAGDRYAKLVRPRRAERLAAGLRRAHALASGAFAVPEVLAADPAAGRVTCAALPGRSLTEALATPRASAAGRAAGAAVRALHAAALPEGLDSAVPLHDAAAEARVLEQWLGELDRFEPERAAALRPLADDALDRLAALPRPAPAPVHRDLHDGQMLLAPGGGVGILDFDTLAAGDPALDVGNLLAHLGWRVRQGLVAAPRAAAVAAGLLDAAGAGAELRERADAYARVAELRLACVYAFRPRWRPVAAAVGAPSPIAVP